MRSPKPAPTPSGSPPIGHNGFTFETRDDLPEYVKKSFHFFKCDADALLRDILKMPLKERGLYMTAILLMYRDLEPLPADDKAAAMALHIHVNQYRELKAKLLKPGLLQEKPSGRITNARWEREITEFVMRHRSYSDAASKREANKRAKAEAQPETPPASPGVVGGIPGGIGGGNPGGHPGGHPGGVPGGIPGHNSKNDNDFNGAQAQSWQNPTTNGGKNKESRKEEEKKEEKTLSPPALESSVAARAGGPEIPGLNGATALIVTDVAKWLSPWQPDEPAAYKQIGEAIRIYGERAVRDGYAEMKADIADGKLRMPSVKSLYGYFRTAKERPPVRSTPGRAPMINSKGWVRT